MTWWCEKGVDGFRMDVISMISKDPAYPDGEIRDGLHGDMSPYVCNGPHVHEYLQEMNQRVLSKFDLITVGETPGAVSYTHLDVYKRQVQARNNYAFFIINIGG